ncbi:MAG TPA: 6-bladed beta-propeller [Gemmatimonadota bacterium]|nr:6-bladed beta-propeller [Gemmatimonadota bacterium]
MRAASAPGGGCRRTAGAVLRAWLTAAVLASACGREAGAGEVGVRVVGVFEPPRAGYFWAPVDVAADGERIWVLDAGAGQVFGYDAGGRYQTAIGRKGRGPGELQDPLALGVAGDTLWILDVGNGRIEHFATSGAHLRSDALPEGLPTPVDMVRWRGSFVGALPFGERPLVRIGPAGRSFVFGAELARRARQLASAGGRIPAIYRLAVVDGELWAAHLYLPLVAVYGPEGRLQRLIEFDAPDPEPVRARIEKRDRGERHLERAPRRPAGTLGFLPLEGRLMLLTHRRDGNGRQALITWRGDDAEPGTAWGPPDLLLVSAAGAGTRSFAVGARGEVEEPAVVILAAEGPGHAAR